MIKTTSKMKIFVLFGVTVNFLNILNCNAECPTTTECLATKLGKTEALELTLIYDINTNGGYIPPAELTKLDDIVCGVVKASGDLVKFKRRPGATVITETNGQIKCGDDCFRIREDACKGHLEPSYFTNCDGAENDLIISELADCVDKKKADQTLKDNGTFRCGRGIPESKLPTVLFNNKYEPCTDFSTVQDLQKFVCTIYDNAIPACQPKNP